MTDRLTDEVALFIDLENITTALWNKFQQAPDAASWVEKARKYGPISFARAYGDFSQPHLARLESDLRAYGIEKFDCPTKQRGGLTQSTVDANIIYDLFEVAQDRPAIKTFVLMAGDSDYIRIVARLRNRQQKDVVIAGVPGSISRDLIRAANIEDSIEPVAPVEIDEHKLIRIIYNYEESRRPGILPTFRYMLQYVSDPRNIDVISPQLAPSKLNDFVRSGILEQFETQGNAGTPVRVTRLNHEHPTVKEALKDI
ncbi:MAG TPA: NYN domain-containing protein [Dehalococcoidia bacterium]|nr:NYN domain-containing protein [Dehalococcoidia bacterium]